MTKPSTPRSQATRDRLLDAAEEVVTRQGASALTLEAVAAAASVSKGGLLYHFPSKDQLAAGLVERAVERVDAELTAASADARPGSFSRAYLRVTFGDEGTDHEQGHHGDPLSTALLGALALDPALLDPLRDAYTTWQARLEDDGIPAEDATLVRLAVDGWWTSLVMDLPPITPALLDLVRRRLLALTTAEGPGVSA